MRERAMDKLISLITRIHIFHDEYQKLQVAFMQTDGKETDEVILFRQKIENLLADLLDYFVSSSKAKWFAASAIPHKQSGLRKVYCTTLDSLYTLCVEWNTSPRHINGNMAYRESYTIYIHGKRQVANREGFLGLRRVLREDEFPAFNIQIFQDDNQRKFRPTTKPELDLLILGEYLKHKSW